ncbi:Lipase [Lachnellula suecica]|uniref:Lipase n=1 Tax=Lachnellula suecica TaxID=602035 RepID=A0A8T9BXP8_9HELO|nr:Lipase [Lachnellula suecica]
MGPFTFSVLAVVAHACLISAEQQPLISASIPHLPIRVAALGDSYSAGLGSGKFLSHSNDGRDNACARMDGSYPWLLSKLNPFHIGQGYLPNFVSCSGNLLRDIDSQIEALDGKRFDVVTLSISGNDFKFGQAVVNCVYPYRLLPGTRRFEKACNDTLTKAQNAIEDPAKWNNFTKVIEKMKSEVLTTAGRIYITGYAKFFAPPRENDACDSTYFFPRRLFAALPMKSATRLRLNSLVDLVNSKTQGKIISQFASSVAFVDIDSHFTGRRFCEPENDEDPIGADNPNVWFNDLTTTLEEDSAWNPETVTPSPERDPWSAWALDLPESVKNDTEIVGRGIGDNLQRASTFHPKKAAHILTAIKLGNMILEDFARQVSSPV